MCESRATTRLPRERTDLARSAGIPTPAPDSRKAPGTPCLIETADEGVDAASAEPRDCDRSSPASPSQNGVALHADSPMAWLESLVDAVFRPTVGPQLNMPNGCKFHDAISASP